MDLAQRRQQLRQKQVEKVKKFRASNQSSSTSSDNQKSTEHHTDIQSREIASAKAKAKQKSRERESMKKQIKKELSKESINIDNSDGVTFARIMDIVGPSHMKPLVSNGVWKGTEQISEKKSDCECDDCGQDPCIECGESHHSVKEELVSERLGGKGYKSYTSLTGKKVSGDWEDSDRGAGNKAKRRAGGKVEKKSPTYRAHVLNKEGMETDDPKQKQIDAKQKKADQIKKQVLLKKLQAVRSGGGSEILASYDWRSDKTMRLNKILNN